MKKACHERVVLWQAFGDFGTKKYPQISAEG